MAPEPEQNGNGLSPPSPDAEYRAVPVPDRVRIVDALGVPDDPLNPYHQSTLKGDRPVFDDWYVMVSAITPGIALASPNFPT